MCVGIPTPSSAVQQRRPDRGRANRLRSRSASWRSKMSSGPQQRDDRLQVAVRHVADVEARPARCPRRPPAPASSARAGRGASPRATGGACPAPGRADGDVERDEQRHAEADQHEVERGDVVGVAQRHVRGVGRDQPDDDEEARRRSGRPARCAGAAAARGRAGAGAPPGGVGPRDRARAASATPSSGRRSPRGCRRAARRSIPTSARARASAVTAMARPARSSSDVVPAEVDGRGDGEGEQDPHRNLHVPPEPEQVRRQRRGEEDRDVQRGEGADALRGAARPTGRAGTRSAARAARPAAR